MAPSDNTRGSANRRIASKGTPDHEIRFHPIAKTWQQGQKVAIINGATEALIHKACARGERLLSEVPDSQAYTDMGPLSPEVTPAVLTSPLTTIVALAPAQEQLQDIITPTPHTQDRTTCSTCSDLGARPTLSTTSTGASALTWSPTPAQRAASPASSIASFRSRTR
ncbi:hypothetical protein EV426DRAFT_625113 [Tirmania nivea]|nr:hypothetical protein EV426DRAFT_625113 [Tirmania nivea]